VEFTAVFFLSHFLFYFLTFKLYSRVASETATLSKGVSIVIFHCLLFLALNFINYTAFPKSIFSWLFQPIFSNSFLPLLLAGIIFTLMIYAFLLIIRDFIHSTQPFLQSYYRVLALFSTMIIFVVFLLPTQSSIQSEVASDKPNIILIGIDSLRPDILSEDLTPTLIKFSQQATTYSNAYTPLARTFPAWVSLLTGKDPVNHGARFNLTDANKLSIQNSLVNDLKSQGYHSLYASDEKHFSNIDQSFGFDSVAGPRIGVTDFLIGSLSDFPVLNLLRKSYLGPYLLPDSYDNRATDKIYGPANFDRTLSRTIKTLPKGPNFIATHFCLPHWPYTWASDGSYNIDKYRNDAIDTDYLRAVHRADLQLKSFLDGLDKAGFLMNAIVVVLSDHGESFIGEEKTIIYSRNGEKIEEHSKWGHGGDLDNPETSKIVLMIKEYNNKKKTTQIVESAVSLIDIRPTILDMLDIEPTDDLDGLPLKSTLQEKLKYRPLFFETGLALPFDFTGTINKARILKARINYYNLLPPSDKLALKEKEYPNLIRQKDIAVLSNNQYIVRKHRRNRDKPESYNFYSHGIKLSNSDYTKLIDTLCLKFSSDFTFSELCTKPY
jgi:arylsulfatase A-like enzyme